MHRVFQRPAKTPDGVTGLKDGDWFAFDNVDLGQGWQSAVLRFASDVAEMNTDKSGQQAPRHQKATDPLVLDCPCLPKSRVTMRLRRAFSAHWTFARNIQDGNWLRFNQVPLGEGYRRFRVVYGTTSAGPQSFEVRLDQLDGPWSRRPLCRRPSRHPSAQSVPTRGCTSTGRSSAQSHRRRLARTTSSWSFRGLSKLRSESSSISGSSSIAGRSRCRRTK